jgi:hypothetical protein
MVDALVIEYAKSGAPGHDQAFSLGIDAGPALPDRRLAAAADEQVQVEPVFDDLAFR